MAGGAKKKRAARGSKKKKKGSTRDVVADLTDDVLVDILSRLPIKSLCRCKLVSTRWLNLISHPEHRKKLPQTLAGFFYDKYFGKRPYTKPPVFHFTNISGVVNPFIDLSLSFLPEYKSIDIKDSCNGLLLCHCWKPTDPVTMDYIVCNPATEKLVAVPDSGWSSKVRITRLGFDPAVSSHFHVFEFIPDDIWYPDDGEIQDIDGRIEVLAVYSSKTGVWSLNENEHQPIPPAEFAMPEHSKSVFFNGVLHLTTFYNMVVAINVEGKILRAIPVPISSSSDPCPYGDIFLSQGHLYLTARFISDGSDDYKLSVWVLEDYNSQNWILKYNVDPLHLFGPDYYSKFGHVFSVISIHPEHDMIFMVCGENNTLVSCEMDHMRLRFISQLGRYGLAPYDPYWSFWSNPFIPYIPLFLESLAEDQH